MPQKRFLLTLIKPSHYDDQGYVIQWFRSAIPSNTLAVLYGLALDCKERRVLGDEVEIVVRAMDETNTRVRSKQIIREHRKTPGLVGLVGVQSNQFPRAMDIARPLRAAGISVCIGGFHVSGVLSMLPGITPELQEAMDLGISLFAGEAEGRFEQVLRDAANGELKPLYNYMNDLPSLDGVPEPILPATRIKRTGGRITTFDAGRGCPFQCSFCTIINVQGRKSRRRTVDDIERIVRRNLAQGINRFFITDDNFARNTRLGEDFRSPDRRCASRKGEYQVRHPGGHDVPPAAALYGEGRPRRRGAGVHRHGEHQSGRLLGARKKQNKIARVPENAVGLEEGGRDGLCGIHRGLSVATRRSRCCATLRRSSASCPWICCSRIA